MVLLWIPIYFLGLVLGLIFKRRALRPGLWLAGIGLAATLLSMVAASGMQMGILIFGAVMSLTTLPAGFLGIGLALGALARRATGVDLRILLPSVLIPLGLLAWLFTAQASRRSDTSDRISQMTARTLSGTIGGTQVRFPAAPFVTVWDGQTKIRLGYDSTYADRVDDGHVFRSVQLNPPGDCSFLTDFGAPCQSPDGAGEWCATRADFATSAWCTSDFRSEIGFFEAYGYLINLRAGRSSTPLGEVTVGSEAIAVDCNATRDGVRVNNPHLSRLCHARFQVAPGVEALVRIDGVADGEIMDVAKGGVVQAKALWAEMTAR